MNTQNIITTNLNSIINQATKQKFTEYLDTNEFGAYRHLIMTCLKGKHNGEVIDIFYTDKGVFNIEHSCQFTPNNPKFKFVIE